MRSAAGPTPAVTIAARAGVEFHVHRYEHDPDEEHYGEEAAEALGVPAERVFKTLVALVDERPVVAVVPVSGSLDLKALAASCGAKRALMAPAVEAERASGYVIGGISPLGQRRRLHTVLDASARSWPTVYVSAGRRGLELELAPDDLVRLTDAGVAPIAA